jgi:hypothetical protein
MYLFPWWSRSKIKVTAFFLGDIALVVGWPFIVPGLVNLFGGLAGLAYFGLITLLSFLGVREAVYRESISKRVFHYFKAGDLGFLPSTEDSLKIYLVSRKNNLSIDQYFEAMKESSKNPAKPLQRDYLYYGYE